MKVSYFLYFFVGQTIIITKKILVPGNIHSKILYIFLCRLMKIIIMVIIMCSEWLPLFKHKFLLCNQFFQSIMKDFLFDRLYKKIRVELHIERDLHKEKFRCDENERHSQLSDMKRNCWNKICCFANFSKVNSGLP